MLAALLGLCMQLYVVQGSVVHRVSGVSRWSHR